MREGGLGVREGEPRAQRRERHARSQPPIAEVRQERWERSHHLARRCDRVGVGDRDWH
jgi:hypothetical protein